MKARTMVFLGWAMVALFWAGRLHAELERDCIRYAANVKVDSDLAKWEGRPFSVFGINSLSEDQLSAVSWIAWSQAGLHFALHIYCDSTHQSDRSQEARDLGYDKIDLFIDVRGPDARMDRYTDGVYHFAARPFSEARPPDVIRINNPKDKTKDTVAGDCSITSKRLSDGWAVEVLVPWTALGKFVPRERTWIATSLRITYTDPRSSVSLTTGPQNLSGSYSLEDVPLAFSPVQLRGRPSGPSPVTVRAEEIVLRGQPWLDLEIVAISPVKPWRGASVNLEIPALGIDRALVLAPSYSGRYWMLREHYPLTTKKISTESVLIALSCPAMGWATTLSVPTRVANRFGLIEAELPSSAIERLGDPEKGIAYALKAGAMEAAANLTAAPDGRSPPEKLFRVVFKPSIYDRQITLFVDEARSFLRGRKAGIGYYFRGWRSNAAQTWLPIQLSVPVNLDIHKRYPLNIRIEANGHGSITAFMNVLKSYNEGTGIDYRGDRFQVWLFGQDVSDSYIGEEETKFLFDNLIPSLPVDASRVSISGYSNGARTALRLVLRHPDRYAWVQTRSGDFSALTREFKEDDILSLLRNLSNSGLFLEAGENDPVSSSSSKWLFQGLQADGIPCDYRVRPHEGHNFIEDVVSPRISEIAIPQHPTKVSFMTPSIDYGASYWITIASIRHPGKAGRVEGRFAAAREVQINSDNVDALSLDCHFFTDDRFPLAIVMDGQEPMTVTTRPLTNTLHLVRNDSHWQLGAAHDVEGKRAGLCGPASRVATGTVVIVYGTKDPARMPFLKERAFRILMNDKMGPPGEGRWPSRQFEVRADDEVDLGRIGADSLWLIGGSEENRVTASVAANTPGDSNGKSAYLGKKRFSTPDVLLSYIYPLRRHNGRYVYIEMGTSARAYLGSIMPSPESDACAQVVANNKAVVIWRKDFDSKWLLQDP